MNTNHEQTEAALLADVERLSGELEAACKRLREHRLCVEAGPRRSLYEDRGFISFPQL